MIQLNSQRQYAQVSGLLLFVISLFELVFRSYTRIPDYYLVAGLLLGFWGLMLGFGKK
jgi:hypothetical protein